LRSKSFWVALVVLVYSVSGFLIAPWAVKKVLLHYIHEYSGRVAIIDTVRMNPYTFSATIRGFSIPEQDGGDFLSFDELYLNFETISLFRRTWTVRELSVSSPRVRLEKRADGSWNYSDLVPGASEEEPSTDDRALDGRCGGPI